MPFLTPQVTPVGTVCFSVAVPNEQRAIAAFYGALLELAFDYNWEKLEDTDISPQEIANLMLDMNDTMGNCETMSVPVGTVMMYCDYSAPAGWLLLDGSVVNKADYPALWDVWPTALKDTTTLTLATMQNHFPRGSTSGADDGLAGGEDNHTLTQAEMPIHSHTVNVTVPIDINPGAVGNTNMVVGPANRGTFNNFAETVGNAGNGEAHNNVPRFRYWSFIVRAL